jgi:RNA polymerase sigma factor (sigma-70 family)
MHLSIVEVVPPSSASNRSTTGDTAASVSSPVTATLVSPGSGIQEAVRGFEDVRKRLFGIAYQMLGRAADAEDVVQDVWVRWQGADRDRVRDPVAFLVTVTTRIALNAATSTRTRREVSVGEGLPQRDSTAVNPEVEAERSEALELAIGLLLQRLSPVERAVYILREAFDYPFRDIAGALKINEANARQVARRARLHLAEHQHEPVHPIERDDFLQTFLQATRAGDIAGLVNLLTDAIGRRSWEHHTAAAVSRCRPLLRTQR